jgi:hypothetical protein
MPSAGHHHPGANLPPPALPTTASSAEAVQSKRDLTSWWKNFKRATPQRVQEEKGRFRVPSASRSDLTASSHANLPSCRAAPQGIFGVPLQTSIRYANVAISLFNEQGQSYIYGYVPIVVAKCGVYLKEKGVSRPMQEATHTHTHTPCANSSHSYRRRGNLPSEWVREAHQRTAYCL